tara:strand:+ start:2466 stop:3083 length:618 start_codon:yes stop_codon:yes gene_type:complete
MNVGDLLHIKGQLDDGSTTIFYAELVGINEDNQLEVYYLEQTKKLEGHIWSYKSDWDVVHEDCVERVFHPTQPSYVSTYKEFGFIPTVKENQFLQNGVEIPSHILVPLPLDSEEEVDEDDAEMNDFIIDDEEANEPFTHAIPDNEFVIETHKAVNQYNQWEPKNGSEKKVKNFIDGLAEKYQTEDDNRQFAKGKSLDYSHPPTKQ